MKCITVLLTIFFVFGMLYSQDIPKEGLVGYWKLDEGEGFVAADSSGYGAHGELIEGAFWTPGYMGNALEFDGETGYLFMGIGEGQFDIEYDLTLSVWANQWEMGNDEHNPWLGKGDHAYAIKHWSGGEYEFFVYTDTWHSCRAPIDSSHLYEWHHFAGTYDGFEMKMYVDGVCVDTVAQDLPIGITEHPLALAWNSEATDRFFTGLLDEAMIYNIALTEEEIKQLYDIKSDVFHERNLANAFRLEQNYPNPFNPETSISYTIPAPLPVTLKIYNTLGEEIQTLVNERQTMGTHTISFNASDMPSGVYLYVLQAGDLLQAKRKMMLVK